MKDINEVSIAGGKVVQSSYKTFEDGKFELTELTNYLDDLFEIIAAGQGFQNSWKELQQSTNDQKENTVNLFDSQLVGVEENDRSDLTGAYGGVISMIRLVARKAYLKGLEDGQLKALQE